MNTHRLLAALFAACLALPHATAAVAQAAGEPKRVVLKGYDSVAYFTEDRAVKGSPEFRREWDGAVYHFANARHRDQFAADPERFAPQFSGLCANAMTYGMRMEADPLVWKIIDGRLYVFAGTAGLEAAERNPAVIVRAAERARAR